MVLHCVLLYSASKESNRQKYTLTHLSKLDFFSRDFWDLFRYFEIRIPSYCMIEICIFILLWPTTTIADWNLLFLVILLDQREFVFRRKQAILRVANSPCGSAGVHIYFRRSASLSLRGKTDCVVALARENTIDPLNLFWIRPRGVLGIALFVELLTIKYKKCDWISSRSFINDALCQWRYEAGFLQN